MLVAHSYEFLIERAEQAAQEAACSVLENVRERALRSETAWRTMSNQVLDVARNRELAAQERLVAGQWLGAPQ
jgi:hypothetical protein